MKRFFERPAVIITLIGIASFLVIILMSHNTARYGAW